MLMHQKLATNKTSARSTQKQMENKTKTLKKTQQLELVFILGRSDRLFEIFYTVNFFCNKSCELLF